MHGCSPGFTLLVNAEVDSMGGVVDCEIGLDTKSSPQRAAIAKAQEELRLEYDVREERRRELEFLEKGGNPLDYKFGRATSISLQSTSLPDQLAEQYVISEAKGSFALAASPHGDSVESSGRPAGSMGREPNIADNLLLFAGETSSPGREKNVRRTGRRSNAAPVEQSSKIDGCRNTKESNDLAIFRLGPSGQAYARRNRYRSSRDTHNNKSPLLPSSHTDARDVKESHEEVHAEEHTVSSIINSKPTSPNAKRVQKSFASKDQLDMEIDGGLACHTQTGTEKPELQVAKIKTCENLKNVDHNVTSVERVVKSSAMQTSDFIGKDSTASAGFLSAPPCAMDNIKGSSHDEDKNYRAADVDVMNAHEDNITGKENVSSTTELVGRKNVDINPLFVSTAHLHGSADSSDSLTFRIGSSVDINSKDHAASQLTSGIRNSVENSQISDSAAYITSNGGAGTSLIKLNNSVQVKDEVQLCDKSDEQAVDRLLSNTEIRINKKSEISQDDSSHGIKTGIIMINSIIGQSHEPSSAILSKKVCLTANEPQNSEANQLKLTKKAHEDAILKEARIIETSLKRAGVLSFSCISSEKQQKCHWHFVLEEMAWMANDFMQERLWKTTAAAQICHWIASVGRSKFEQENLCQKQRNVARTLAKAVMNFWGSVGAILTKGEASSGMKEDCDANLFKASNISNLNTMKDQSVEACGGFLKPGIQSYARKLLKYLSDASSDPILAEAPRTPDRIKDAGSFGVFLDDQLSEESLFYKVLPGAMHSYRESIESQCAQVKEEECEASMCDSVADGSRGIAFEEDEGETGADMLPGAFEGNYSAKFIHKKRRFYQQKSYTTRYETDLSYDPCLEGKSASHSLVIMGKRPSCNLNVSAVPTKRIRTAARQRIISPFNAGPTVTSKTDVSSGDTTSFQDDQSSRHGCSQPQKNFEVDSTVDFERLLPFDSSDIPMKPKKKKKPKHLGYKSSLNLPDSKASSYEQRLQADYMVQQDQRDHAKKRSEGLQFESNGNIGFYGQNVAKKPKLSKRADSPETITPAGGSMPSPVASQMSNMSNSNKLIRIISNRDRGRKSKALKMAAGQSGPGVAWSTFEDQALVVLVHDMGLNWELVSDALNSTLHFKCIYRKPIDCKERHKFLMDKSAGDGADSAEDSGSSQPYPSTLPGIPKGSARQLFQRLQGPMEEDTMKSHFEKIILIGQRLHSCRTQDNKQQLKQITPAHSSHVLVLSQACPNYLSGPILSPVDLADAMNSSPDAVGLGYQGSHANGIVIPGHQGSLAPVLPNSSTNSMLLQGTPSMVLGNGLPTPSPPLHASPRDAQRYGVHRSTTLPVDDQKRLQQYSQNFSGRNMQQSGISMTSALSAGVDRGVRMLPGGNGMGMMCGVNRSMSMPRTGFQGVSPAGMLNMVSPNNMLSSNVVGMPNPMGTHSSSVSSPGNTMLRPRDALQMLRPGQTTEETRQIMMQEIQLQVSQGNAQAITPFNGMSAPFSNAPVPPPVQTIPLQQHQPHQIPQQPHILGNPNNSLNQGTNHSSSQQQAYIRFAKENQLQPRIMPQVQHPYSCSSTMSPMENNSQFQQQSQSSSPVNSIASSQPQHKQQPMPRNSQTSSMMSSQIMKQRQRQQVQQQQQQPRNLQQQKQQAQQQAKLVKGLGRGTMLLHQNLQVDATQVGGRPTTPNNQASEKLLIQQSQGFNPVSTGLSSNLQQPSIPQKLYPRPHPPQSKKVPPMPSHPDNNQASIQAPPTHSIRATQQSIPATPPATHQQQQRLANQSPTNMQRIMLPQSRQSNHDGRIQSINEPVQVNQMIPSSSLPKTSESSSLPAVVSSGVHWKPEQSFETCTTGEKAQLAAIPQESFAGNDAMIPPSTQGLVQRQLSGNISIHGHGVGGQWQQQKQLQPTPLPQQQHRQGVQGNLYTRSSNTGP